MSDDSMGYLCLETDCNIELMSDDEWSSEEYMIQQLKEDITTSLEYSRVAEHIVYKYSSIFILD